MNSYSALYKSKWPLKSALISLVISGLVPTGIYSQEITQTQPGLFVTSKIVKELPFLPKNRLTIQSAKSLSGSLTIQATDNPGLTITYTKKARTSQRSRAFDYIDLISVNLSKTGDRGKIVIRAPNPGTWEKWSESGLVDAVISVPVDCYIEIDALAFNVKAVGPFSGMIIPASYGRIDISNVTGPCKVKTANQKLSLNNISGEISAVTSNAQLLAKSLKASNKTAQFKNSQGEIKIVDFEGSIKVHNSLGRIEILRLIPTGLSNFISGSSAPITVDIVNMSKGQLVINNRDEDIEINVPDNMSAYYFFSVGDNGSIDASGLQVKTELVKPGRLNLISGEGGVDISGSIRGEGNISLRGIESE